MREGQQLFFTPGSYFDGLLADIDVADSHIGLEIYIFELDTIGERVLQALERAIARGVKLQLLIDGVGSYRDANAIAERLDRTGCELRVFHPLPWDFSLYRRALSAGRWYSKFLHFFAAINHRNHRKLCLIDGKYAWLGSYNITDDHFNRPVSGADDYWHDTGLRVSGPMVNTLSDNFPKSGNARRSMSVSAHSTIWQAGKGRIGSSENCNRCKFWNSHSGESGSPMPISIRPTGCCNC